MKTYQSYTPSGIEWIGEIPDHWELLKFKFLFKEKKTVQNLELNCGSISFGKVIEKDDEGIPIERKLTYQEVLKDEFLINPLNLNFDLKSLRIGKSDINVVVSPGYIVLNLFKEGNNKQFYNYLLYVFDTQQMKSLGNGVRQTISFKHLSVEELLSPPLQEQEQIVKYLDDKTSIIDKLISTKERKIELLKEQRSSLINEVITKGLDPNVKMKDSGVEWIGEIPERWCVKKMKYCLKMISEKKVVSKDDIKISPENVENETGVCFNFHSEYTGEGMRFIKGDILLNKLRIYLKKILITENEGFSMGEMIVLRTIDGVNKYYFYTLFNQGLIDLLNNQSTGVKLPRVSPDTILNTEIIYPPIKEQMEIVKYIDLHSKEINDLIQLEQKKIEFLKEYRQSLISEVITGKIKVVE